jgi:phage shock protein PspC (stress-responsive transcriptional regulator)
MNGQSAHPNDSQQNNSQQRRASQYGGPSSNGSRHSLDDMVNRIRFVRRSRENRVLGGVAGGLAETLEVDPTVVRIIIVVFALSTGIGFLAYFGAWALLPKQERNAVGIPEKPRKRTSGRTLAAIALVSIGAINLFNTFGIHLNNDYLLPMTLIGLGSAVLFTNGRRPVSPARAGADTTTDGSINANAYGPGFDAGPWPTTTERVANASTTDDDAILPQSAVASASGGSATWPSIRTSALQQPGSAFPSLRVASPTSVDPEKAHALHLARQEIDALTAHEQYWPRSADSSGTSSSNNSPGHTIPLATKAAVATVRKSPYARKAFAVLLLIGGAMTMSATQNWFDFSISSLMALGLMLIGGGLVLGAWLGRPIGFIFVGLVLSVGLMSAAILSDTWDKGFGAREFRPVAAADLKPSYALAIGELKLVIPKAALKNPTTKVNVKLGVGHLMVTVPDDAIVRLHATAKAGEISMFGRNISGNDLNKTATFTPKATIAKSSTSATTPADVPGTVSSTQTSKDVGANAPVIDLTAKVELGQIQVLRETEAAALAAADATDTPDPADGIPR